MNCIVPGGEVPGLGSTTHIFGKLRDELLVDPPAASPASQWGAVKQPPPHRTVKSRSDEPKLEIGEKIPIEEGVVGVVLARYTRSDDPRHDVHYIVELRQEGTEHR